MTKWWYQKHKAPDPKMPELRERIKATILISESNSFSLDELRFSVAFCADVSYWADMPPKKVIGKSQDARAQQKIVKELVSDPDVLQKLKGRKMELDFPYKYERILMFGYYRVNPVLRIFETPKSNVCSFPFRPRLK